MCEKSEGSLGYEHVNSLPGNGGFPENYLPRNSQETPQESSVEYLQAVAKVRLYLSKAAELLFDLHEPTGKSILLSNRNAVFRAKSPWEMSWMWPMHLCCARTCFDVWLRTSAPVFSSLSLSLKLSGITGSLYHALEVL